MVRNRVIALRTLNYLRATHLPTYVALRLLLESTAQTRLGGVLDGIIDQAAIRRSQRTIKLRRFKSIDEGRFRYRDYFVSSPSEALSDSYALERLYAAGALVRSADVYSYRPPPTRDYGRNFEHFSVGYKERNESIASALKRYGGIALVTDVKSCYPSIPGERAVDALLEKMAGVSIEPRDSVIVRASAERAVEPDANGRAGLRVGLEFSHALANTYLMSLDASVGRKYSGRYFRYVDDIVLVVDPSEVSEALGFLDQGLESLGLKRNHDKDATADEREWGEYRLVGARSLSGASDCLASLKFRLKLFLARNPSRISDLAKTFEDKGIYLPLDQLLHGAENRAWRERVADLFAQGWRVLLQYRFDEFDDVVSAAVSCRAQVLSLMDEAVERGISGSSGSVPRRWRVQAARFAINRSLYFADRSSLNRIIEFSAAIPELAETHAVCQSLIGNISHLIFTSGPAVAAATQLMALRGVDLPEETAELSLIAGDAISADLEAHAALRGLGSFDFDVTHRSPDLRGLVALSRRLPFETSPFGYGSEVASLACNVSQSRLAEVAATRFTSREEVVLDALSLGNYLS